MSTEPPAPLKSSRGEKNAPPSAKEKNRHASPAEEDTIDIPRWTLTAEIVKYSCFNVLIAIALPPFVIVPIRYHEAVVGSAGQQPGFSELVGLPDLLLSCAILVWGAFRDTLDAEHWTKPVQQIFLSLTTVLGLADIGIAVAVHNVTADNFLAVSRFLTSISMAAGVLSLAISAGISIGRGVLRERGSL